MPTVLNPSSEDVRLYEISILSPTNLLQKEEQELQKDIEDLLIESGAKVLDRDVWKRCGLAYPIRRHREGRMTILTLELPPEKVKPLEKGLQLVRNLLRFLVVKLPKDYKLIRYSEVYEEWLKDKEAQESRKREVTEQELKKKIVRKSAAKEKESAAPVTVPAEALAAPAFEEKLEELISDEDLHL
jgi:ribosomal protein S6